MLQRDPAIIAAVKALLDPLIALDPAMLDPLLELDPLYRLAFLDELILEANARRLALRDYAAKQGYRSALDGKIHIDD